MNNNINFVQLSFASKRLGLWDFEILRIVEEFHLDRRSRGKTIFVDADAVDRARLQERRGLPA